MMSRSFHAAKTENSTDNKWSGVEICAIRYAVNCLGTLTRVKLEGVFVTGGTYFAPYIVNNTNPRCVTC